MKKTLNIFAVAIFLVAVCWLIFSKYIIDSSDDTSNSDNSVQVEEVETVAIVDFFVPVVAYSRLQNNISYADLLNEKICALDETADSISHIFADKEINYIEAAQIEETIKLGEICLLPPEQVSFHYKSLAVDGHLFWEKDKKLTDYPLKYTFETTAASLDKELQQQRQALSNVDNRNTIFISGEIIPARAVDRLALNQNNNYTYLYDYFREDIETADLAIGLLENPINGNPAPCTGCMSFVGDEQNALGLKKVGFDILSLAGNHAGDGGLNGYKRTIDVLGENGILTAGAGNSDEAKIKPAIYTVNGKKHAVISADTVAGYYWNKGGSYYGTNWFSKSMNSDVDYDRVALIKELKEKNEIDYLIIYMSWGVEYTNKATNFQKELAHALIDNGADLIVASHPHWVQNIEIYNGKPIFYALGNFIFDQNHTDPTREGVNLNLYYADNELKSIEIMPHLACGPFISSVNLTNKYLAGEIDREYLNNNDEQKGCVYFQPKKLNEQDKHYQRIWERMMQHSDLIK